MPLEVHPATEADLLEWTRLHYEAFKPTTVGCLWLREPSEESFRDRAAARTKLFSNPQAHIFKCIDTDLNNKIISVAYWSVFDAERTWKEVEEGLQPRPTFPEDNAPARLYFMEGICKSRREVMGTKPHVMLESLVTHPDHHRRGAGSMLLKWGVGEADKLGIVAYLEGSAAGAPLYKKFGYEPVRDIEFDSTKYGGERVDIHVASGIRDRLRDGDHKLILRTGHDQTAKSNKSQMSRNTITRAYLKSARNVDSDSSLETPRVTFEANRPFPVNGKGFRADKQTPTPTCM
jgi:GNAT superfamily N-acetyltransferase